MRSISVIVPVYYGEKYIPDIIQQIEDCRKYLDKEDSLEVLFVNDAPDAPITCDWQSRTIRLIILNTDKNAGIHGARVKGFKKCHGDYVLFFDQDDKICPEYFHSQLLSLGENDAVICKALNAGKEYYTNDGVFENMASKEFVLRKWNRIVSPGQVLMRRSAVPDVWTEHIMENNGADDWLLWLCMLAEGCRFSLNEQVLYEHISHSRNASDNLECMAQSEHEVMRIVQKERIFNERDFQLLMEGFFLRNLVRVREMHRIKRKMDILDRWMKLRERHVEYSEYLRAAGIQSAAICGCGILGEHLYSELKLQVDIKFFIDRNAGEMNMEIPVYTWEEPWPEADCIIVTLVEGEEKAAEDIKERTHKKVLVLKDWIMKTEL